MFFISHVESTFIRGNRAPFYQAQLGVLFMAQLQFDAPQVQPDTGFDVLPAGWYKVAVTESDIKPTKDGQGMYLAVTYTVIDGQFRNRKIFGRFNLKNNNPMAQEIGYKQLSALA